MPKVPATPRPTPVGQPKVDEPIVDRMRASDVDAIVAIDAEGGSSPSWNAAQLHDELARAWAYLWVVRAGRDDAPIAYLATWLVADEIHVLNLATAPSHRRRGLARMLLAHAIAVGVERGARLVLLEVRRSNAPAIGLYRALGFAAMGVRERYYGDGEDAVEMILRLDERGQPIAGRDEVRLS
jgi:ribosomal-protein-alanine N-acetyltransferase